MTRQRISSTMPYTKCIKTTRILPYGVLTTDLHKIMLEFNKIKVRLEITYVRASDQKMYKVVRTDDELRAEQELRTSPLDVADWLSNAHSLICLDRQCVIVFNHHAGTIEVPVSVTSMTKPTFIVKTKPVRMNPLTFVLELVDSAEAEEQKIRRNLEGQVRALEAKYDALVGDVESYVLIHAKLAAEFKDVEVEPETFRKSLVAELESSLRTKLGELRVAQHPLGVSADSDEVRESSAKRARNAGEADIE